MALLNRMLVTCCDRSVGAVGNPDTLDSYNSRGAANEAADTAIGRTSSMERAGTEDALTESSWNETSTK